jgi:hypothetical protein
MEDTRITFETAKLAKGKGFPQETNRLEIPYYNYKGEFKGDVSDWRVRKYIRGEDTSDVESVSAPTQSLLAKWLRKEHNLYVYPILQYPYYGYEIRKIQDDDKLLKEEIQIGDEFEEAYEIGLQEALKLI